ncbi:MAG: hypothetical protein AAGU05_09735, partial [Anaerolineaceae bacterium]
WRRKGWSLYDQKLLKVVGQRSFGSRDAYLELLPGDLPPQFRSVDLARAASIPAALARKITYTLSRAGWLIQAGKQGRSNLFEIAPAAGAISFPPADEP